MGCISGLALTYRSVSVAVLETCAVDVACLFRRQKSFLENNPKEILGHGWLAADSGGAPQHSTEAAAC